MELLLTGSTGFVGRNLLLHLLSGEGCSWDKINLPVRDPEKLRRQLAGEGIDVSSLDGRLRIFGVSDDAWELPPGVRPDLVIHAAGRLFGREREEYFRTNVEGSRALAAQLSPTSRMIILSSLAAGGPTPEGVEARTTGDADAPVSFYGESKLAMERELRARLGARLLVLRPPMVLGPQDAATVPLFQMAKGWVRVKPGLAPKYYSWISVEDLCEAILKVSLPEWPELPDRPFYLTGEGVITDGQLLSTAAEVLGRRGTTLPLPQVLIQIASQVLDAVPAWRGAVPSLGRDRVKEILPDRWVVDGKDFSGKFAWQPCRGLFETLRETAEWLKAQEKI